MRNGYDVSTPAFSAINANNFNSEDYQEKQSRKGKLKASWKHEITWVEWHNSSNIISRSKSFIFIVYFGVTNLWFIKLITKPQMIKLGMSVVVMNLGNIMTHAEFGREIIICSRLIKMLDHKRLTRVKIVVAREEVTNAPRKEIIIHTGIHQNGQISQY